MLRLACVLLYQGRFKSHRSGWSRISLRVRRILVTFCIYFCSSYTLFLFHFQFSSVCILAVCLCMHVCLCVVCRTRGSMSNMLVVVVVVLVLVLVVLLVLLVLVGVVVALLVRWISVPRSHLVCLPRSHPDIIAIKVGFYSTVLVSVPGLHCKALYQWKHCSFCYMQICRLLSLVACATRVGGALKMTKWWFEISCE